MPTLIPGEWYLILTCKNCKLRQVLFPDPANGTLEIAATYSVACRGCDYSSSYNSEMIERYRHPTETQPEIIERFPLSRDLYGQFGSLD